METITYEFNETKIEFQLNGDKDVKVNATQMAKVFSKSTKDFLRNEQTISFINECLKKDNSPFLDIKNKEDLIVSKQKSGTYMHRVLALKFAAWLNPAFELWVYMTIEKLIFGHFAKQKKRLENKAKNLNRIEILEKQLMENSTFTEYVELQGNIKKDIYLNRKENVKQLNFLKELFKENDNKTTH